MSAYNFAKQLKTLRFRTPYEAIEEFWKSKPEIFTVKPNHHMLGPNSPLHAFFVRIRARRGHQIAAVAVARKLTVLCWHLLMKETDYRWMRPALVANKRRAMELRSGQPQKKGNKPGPASAYNIKAFRDQEMEIVRHAEQAYEHFVAQWETRPKDKVRGRPKLAGL